MFGFVLFMVFKFLNLQPAVPELFYAIKERYGGYGILLLLL